MTDPNAINRAFLEREVTAVARELLGATIRSRFDNETVAIRLTEVEAYAGVGEDPPSHAHRGTTPRNSVMFGAAGHAHVYFVYGMHWCLNVVTGPIGQASAVLLRAGEVTEGLATARARRPGAKRDADLARGPACLAAALGIASSTVAEVNGLDLIASKVVDAMSVASTLPVSLELPRTQIAAAVTSSARIGVREPGDAKLWRFYLEGDPTVSRTRRGPGVRQDGRGRGKARAKTSK